MSWLQHAGQRDMESERIYIRDVLTYIYSRYKKVIIEFSDQLR